MLKKCLSVQRFRGFELIQTSNHFVCVVPNFRVQKSSTLNHLSIACSSSAHSTIHTRTGNERSSHRGGICKRKSRECLDENTNIIVLLLTLILPTLLLPPPPPPLPHVHYTSLHHGQGYPQVLQNVDQVYPMDAINVACGTSHARHQSSVHSKILHSLGSTGMNH